MTGSADFSLSKFNIQEQIKPFIPQARDWKEKIKGIASHRVRRERQDAPADIIVRRLNCVRVSRPFGAEINSTGGGIAATVAAIT